MSFTDEMSLGEAREVLRGLVREGHECPCCTQYAKVYKRRLNARMAVSLIKMLRAGAMFDYVHLPTVAGDGCEGGKLRYWGLVLEESERRKDGGRSGWWTLTLEGVEFVCARALVPSHALIYNGRLLRLDGKPISIKDALGTKFDYRELMDQ